MKADPLTMIERVIEQLAEKLRYFEAVVSSKPDYGSMHRLSIYDKKQRNPHRRDSTMPVAMVRQFTKAGETANWYKIESVNERARRYRPYVKKLVGKEFGSTPQLEMAVRCAAFEYEARQQLKKEVLDVLQRDSLLKKEVLDVLHAARATVPDGEG